METIAPEAPIAADRPGAGRHGGGDRGTAMPQREIERRALAHQRAVESGARVIVGVNRFTDGAPEPAVHLRPCTGSDAAHRERRGARGRSARLRNTRVNTTEACRAGAGPTSAGIRAGTRQPFSATSRGSQSACHPGRNCRRVPRYFRGISPRLSLVLRHSSLRSTAALQKTAGRQGSRELYSNSVPPGLLRKRPFFTAFWGISRGSTSSKLRSFGLHGGRGKGYG